VNRQIVKLGLLLLLSGCHGSTDVLAPPPFTVTTELLAPLPTRDIGDAYAINDDSVVVGSSYNRSLSDSARRAALWSPGQPPRGLLSTPPSAANTVESWATGINAAGVVVGYMNTSTGPRPIRWNTDGSVDTLPTLDPQGGWAYAISTLGQIVGCSYMANGKATAVMWSPTGVMTELDSTAIQSCAYGISGDGTYVVGAQGNGIFVYGANGVRAFLWKGGNVRDLGTFGGDWSVAWGVNRSGEVVGEASDSADLLHAFTWFERDGVMNSLPGLTSGTNRSAYAVNDSGQVVGYSWNEFGQRATAWWSGYLIDLATTADPTHAGEIYSYARAISPSGLVAGFVARPEGTQCNGGICAAVWRVTLR
jgi:probable HAF family extracellular repeat protein